MSFIPVYVYFIAMSLLVGLFTYSKKSPVYLKLLIPFLLLTLAAEIYGNYLSYVKEKNNTVIYNPFSVFEFDFYFFLLTCVIRKKKVKNLIWISMVIYTVGAVVNIFFIQGINTFHTTSYAAGCLLLVSFCVYYFSELFRTPGQGKLVYNPAFWICTGLLFFYCCGFPLYGLMNLWGEEILEQVYSSFELITTILNMFLYTLFTIAFLCSKSRHYTLS